VPEDAENVTPELSVRQRRALEAVVSQPTISQAAKAAGVSRRALYAYLRAPAFREALHALQNERLRLVSLSVSAALQEAVDVLRADLQPGHGQGALRLRAAAILAQHAASLIEFADLEGRVSALEAKAKEAKP